MRQRPPSSKARRTPSHWKFLSLDRPGARESAAWYKRLASWAALCTMASGGWETSLCNKVFQWSFSSPPAATATPNRSRSQSLGHFSLKRSSNSSTDSSDLQVQVLHDPSTSFKMPIAQSVLGVHDFSWMYCTAGLGSSSIRASFPAPVACWTRSMTTWRASRKSGAVFHHWTNENQTQTRYTSWTDLTRKRCLPK